MHILVIARLITPLCGKMLYYSTINSRICQTDQLNKRTLHCTFIRDLIVCFFFKDNKTHNVHCT